MTNDPLNCESLFVAPTKTEIAPASESKGRFSIIVPVFNSRQHLKASLDSILAAIDAYGNAELILVDNGSTDGSFEIMSRDYGQARLYQSKDVTIAALRNYAAQFATGEFLVFIDSDCVVPANYLHQAITVFNNVCPDATGSRYVLPRNPHWIERSWYALHERQRESHVNYINSGNFLIKKSLFQQLGGFDAALITGEDSEIGSRMNRLGYKIYESQNIQAAHLGNEKDIKTFFKKHAWRGLGMFGSRRNPQIHKIAVLTMLHLLLLFCALLSLVVLPVAFSARLIGALLLFNFVPVATVLLRARRLKNRDSVRWGSGLFLYHLFYLARIYAFFCILTRRKKQIDAHAQSTDLQESSTMDSASGSCTR